MASNLYQAVYAQRGIALTFLASIIWSLNSLGTKFSTKTVSPWTLCFVNSLLYLPSLFFIQWESSHRYHLSDGLLILFTGVFDSLSLCFATLGLTYTAIGNACALIFSKPLLCVILAKLFLNESLVVYDIGLVVINFLGVVLIFKPPLLFGNTFTDVELLGSVAALVSAVCGAFVLLFIRKLVARDAYDPALLLLVKGIVGHVFYGFLIFTNITSQDHMKTPLDWSFVILTCLAAVVACTLTYLALKSEDASVVALVTTAEVVWSYLLQVVFTDDRLEPSVAVGAVLIMIAPVFLAVRGILSTQPENENEG